MKELEYTHLPKDLIFYVVSIIIFVVLGSLNLPPMVTAVVLTLIYVGFLVSVIFQDRARKEMLAMKASRLLAQTQLLNSTVIFTESVLLSDPDFAGRLPPYRP